MRCAEQIKDSEQRKKTSPFQTRTSRRSDLSKSTATNLRSPFHELTLTLPTSLSLSLTHLSLGIPIVSSSLPSSSPSSLSLSRLIPSFPHADVDTTRQRSRRACVGDSRDTHWSDLMEAGTCCANTLLLSPVSSHAHRRPCSRSLSSRASLRLQVRLFHHFLLVLVFEEFLNGGSTVGSFLGGVCGCIELRVVVLCSGLIAFWPFVAVFLFRLFYPNLAIDPPPG